MGGFYGKKRHTESLVIVAGKKDAVTAGPSTAHVNQQVVEVSDFEELTRKNLEALVAGGTPPKFVIKGSK